MNDEHEPAESAEDVRHSMMVIVWLLVAAVIGCALMGAAVTMVH